MHCAACSADVPAAADFCDACGAAVYRDAPKPPAEATAPAAGTRTTPRHGRIWLWLGLPLAGVAVAGATAGLIATPLPQVSAGTLEAGLRAGAGPGRDPVCVANGLAYDVQAVNVEAGNSGTLAWMDALVAAGLYAPAADGASGGTLPQTIRVYQPQPELAEWNGARRLCMARAVRLDAVRNLGPVQPMRFRGESYAGVAADVVWTLDDPAPWLAAPGVSAAFSNELPSWRGARWEIGPDGWHLTQRKHFFLHGTQWLSSESMERQARAPDATTARR